MRVGTTLAVMLVSSIFAAGASADPQLEASGFVGIASFGENSQLGNSWAPDQVPSTAPVVGGRIAWLVAPEVATHFAIGVEAELSFASAFTGGAAINAGGSGRMSYFAPVFGWRAHAVVRLRNPDGISPQLVVGAGGETIASSSPFMAKETDPVGYWGLATSFPIADGWTARLDVRHGLMPGRDGIDQTFEVQLGVGTTFGPAHRRTPQTGRPAALVAHEHDETDTDGDGIPDHLDKCPNEPETVNGIADDDGCPELDPDGDGILGDADKCPDKAEDFDGFEDADGCPEADNDGDGIEDARDQCPNQPETRNGFEDADGCPDEVPVDIAKLLASGAEIRFEANRARLTPATQSLLQRPLAILRSRTDLRLAVVGHPPREAAGADLAATDLAKRRAEAVKWFLVDQGIAQDRIVTVVGPASKEPIELSLAIGDAAAPH